MFLALSPTTLGPRRRAKNALHYVEDHIMLWITVTMRVFMVAFD
jgi:hypothetical protein